MMFTRLRQRQPGAPLYRILWWHFLHALCCIWIYPCYRYRAWGVANIPAQGPVLLVSNHQSFLDPILVGLSGYRRQFYAMARSTLFKHKLLAWVIRSLNAIPVERGAGDMSAMRRCIEVLNKEQALLIFPEGTRTPDGVTRAFATGTFLLIKRAGPRVVPVAIEGAFHAWPRERKRPRVTGKIGVMFGEPIEAAELVSLGPEAAMERLRNTVETMRKQIAEKLG